MCDFGSQRTKEVMTMNTLIRKAVETVKAEPKWDERSFKFDERKRALADGRTIQEFAQRLANGGME